MIKTRGSRTLHLLDRYGGIPTVALLASAKKKRSLPPEIESIGLLKAAAIGDTVLMSAVIADLREAYPQATLIFFCGESNHEIACMLAGIDRVIRVPTRNPAAGVKQVRSAAVDVLLDFGSWSRLEALFSLLSRAAFTVGFFTPGQGRHRAYDLVVEHSSEVHEVENYRRLVQALGVKTGHLPFLPRPKGVVSPRGAYAVFHMWPGGRRRQVKEWPQERWRLLIGQFAEWGIEVFLTGARADYPRNHQLMASLSSRARGFVKNAAGLPLRETAALLASSKIVVSVDTGVMHMAGALRAPLVALHGPSSSQRWGPLNKEAVVVESALRGHGCISLGWERASHAAACMEGVRYQAVQEACCTLLAIRSGSIQKSVERELYSLDHEDKAHETTVGDD